jgi:Tn3 transposase DDE domain
VQLPVDEPERAREHPLPAHRLAFGDEAIDWKLIETHWTDLLRTTISIREGRLSSVKLLRRLGNHTRKNRLYRAFRELGRAIRTITLLLIGTCPNPSCASRSPRSPTATRPSTGSPAVSCSAAS